MTEWINMENFKQKAYNVFELFDQQWALVTAGSAAHFNSCTVGWAVWVISGDRPAEAARP